MDEREGPVKFHVTTHAFRKTEQESGALREAEGMGRERMSQPGSGGGGGVEEHYLPYHRARGSVLSVLGGRIE